MLQIYPESPSKSRRGEDIEDVEDIDKEIALFKRSLERVTSNTIGAREFADKVLYPFFFYCKEKLEQFLDVFEQIDSSGSRSVVKKADNQVSTLQLSEDQSNAWPENAFSIFTYIVFVLWDFQGKHKVNFKFKIENETDSVIAYGNFTTRIPTMRNIQDKI